PYICARNCSGLTSSKKPAWKLAALLISRSDNIALLPRSLLPLTRRITPAMISQMCSALQVRYAYLDLQLPYFSGRQRALAANDQGRARRFAWLCRLVGVAL